MEPRNRCQSINSASLCSLAGRYDNPIPTRCLAPIDFLKIPALLLFSLKKYICTLWGRVFGRTWNKSLKRCMLISLRDDRKVHVHYLVVERHFPWERSSHAGWWNVFIRSRWYNHLYLELIFSFLTRNYRTAGNAWSQVLQLKRFLMWKRLLNKFNFKIAFSFSIFLLSWSTVSSVYWHIPDQRQVVFFVILFLMFCMYALFTSFLPFLPRGSMWGLTAVEI